MNPAVRPVGRANPLNAPASIRTFVSAAENSWTLVCDLLTQTGVNRTTTGECLSKTWSPPFLREFKLSPHRHKKLSDIFLGRALKRGNRSNDASFESRFSYRADDVVLLSYPKSGSTWVRFILADVLAGKGDIHFLKTQLRIPELSASAADHGVDFERLPSPRIVRTHAMYFPECRKAVYLLRDGRDVMVSFYFHYQKFHGFAGSFLEFLEHAHRSCEWAPWDQHVDSWIFDNPTLDRVCVIRYEALLADTFREMKKIICFGKLNCSDDELRRSIQRCTFEKMQRIEKEKGLGYVDPGNTDIAFIRKGGRGHWREFFGQAEKSIFKERYGRPLIEAGYESSFEW